MENTSKASKTTKIVESEEWNDTIDGIYNWLIHEFEGYFVTHTKTHVLVYDSESAFNKGESPLKRVAI